MIQGTYGIAVMHKDKPDELHAARFGSPIVVGIGEDSHFLASDPSALLAHTKDVVYLEDGDVALLTPDGYDIISLHNGSPAQKMQERIEWDLELIQKNGYEHFMLKEIFEAPEVIENTIRGRLIAEKGRAKLGGLESVLPQLRDIDRLDITGCGSAYYASLTGSYLLEEYGDTATSVSLASEYRYRQFHHSSRGALLSVSQSGETADTLAAIKKAREQDQLTLGVVNVVGSSIARSTHAGVYNHAGPEIAVASTKAFISQLTVFALLTLLIGRERSLSLESGQALANELQTLPVAIARMLESTTQIQEIAVWLAQFDNALYIGRHAHAPIAYEGALKLKEVTYMHAEGYPGGELKHGPIALLDERCPVIALAPTDHVHDKMIANMEEVRARSAPVVAITTEDDTKCAQIADYVIQVPKVHSTLQPIVSTVPLHLLAYHTGIAKGYNVDRPRNLAKSVTVE
jgi:glucosamine--fructose-6-phosphate aminotransferase (isomerizing)